MIAHVRSLYIPHIAHHPHGANLKEEELAMQIVDIVTLRPEIELCYMGLARKCYEIIENKYLGRDNRVYSSSTVDGSATGIDDNTSSSVFVHDWEDDEEDESEDDADSEDLGDVGEQTDNILEEADEEDDEESDDEEDQVGVGGKRPPRLKLREILFYDDKVSIFKARHGHL